MRCLQMNRDGIVNQRADIKRFKPCHQLIALVVADNIEMIDMPGIGIDRGCRDSSVQPAMIDGCYFPPRLIMGIEVLEFGAQDGGLKLIKAAVCPARLMDVAACLTIIAPFSQTASQLGILRDDRAAIAIGAQILGRIKAECAKMPDSADLPPFIFGAVCLGTVFNQQEVVLIGDDLSASRSAGRP